MAKLKIFIADDHVLFREGLATNLRKEENFEIVGEANNGMELIEKLKVQEVDLVLLDLKMPVMDGIGALREIQLKWPTMKVIVISMIENDQYILHLIKKGANGYLLKNSDTKEVVKAINTVMQKGMYFNEAVSAIMAQGIQNKKRSLPLLNDQIQLTDRENEILQMICKQMTTAEIAKVLFLSTRTIEGHRKNLLDKFAVKNVAGLVIKAFRMGLVE